MKKSIGGKIAVVLSALALVFVIAMGLNLAALIAIRDFNNDICNYMEMQQVKGEISIAFQEEKAVLDRVYFNQTGEEFESRRSSILSSMDMKIWKHWKLCACGRVIRKQLNCVRHGRILSRNLTWM